MVRLRFAGVATALVLAGIGCNAILGIESADLPVVETSAGQGGAPVNAQGGAGSALAGAGGAPIIEEPAPEVPGLLGKPCTENGSTVCNERAGRLVLLCQGSPLHWTQGEICDGSLLCDGRSPAEAPNTSGSCQPMVPICEGQAPGAVVCEGALRHVCGPDLITSETETCASPQLCELGVTRSGCAVCQPGEHRCVNNILEECGVDNLQFVPKATCETAALCNAGAGQCTSSVCVVGQRRCTGDQLEVCNASLSGFDPEQACGPGLCDAVNKRCNQCVPGQKRCAGTTSLTCNSDGQGETSEACNICVGQGQCADCTNTDLSHCTPNFNKCLQRTCAAGQCTLTPNDGAPCGPCNLSQCLDGVCEVFAAPETSCLQPG
jgi:hypothetical protein